jgi:universal stress protein E
MGAMPIEADFVDALGDAHLEAFVALAKHYGIAKENAYYLTGTPLPAIKKFAVDNSVDVLVMGTRPHHNLDLVLGDTAENILQHAPCSVLVVKA